MPNSQDTTKLILKALEQINYTLSNPVKDVKTFWELNGNYVLGAISTIFGGFVTFILNYWKDESSRTRTEIKEYKKLREEILGELITLENEFENSIKKRDMNRIDLEVCRIKGSDTVENKYELYKEAEIAYTKEIDIHLTEFKRIVNRYMFNKGESKVSYYYNIILNEGIYFFPYIDLKKEGIEGVEGIVKKAHLLRIEHKYKTDYIINIWQKNIIHPYSEIIKSIKDDK